MEIYCVGWRQATWTNLLLDKITYLYVYHTIGMKQEKKISEIILKVDFSLPYFKKNQPF